MPKQTRSKRSRAQQRDLDDASSLTTLSRGLGFPRKLRAKHIYTEPVTLTQGAGTTGTYQWSCNGLYDPNITSTGTQPLYFDQLSAIYDHYTCFLSKITLKVISDKNIRYALYIDDDTSTASTVQQASQQTGAISGMHCATAVVPSFLTRTWDGKKYFGGNLMDNDNLQGNIGANPTEQSYFTLLVSGVDPLVAYNVDIFVDLEFDVVWDELKTMTTS